MYCVWVGMKFIPASAASRAERSLTLMLRCLQNIPNTKPTSGSKRPWNSEEIGSHYNISWNWNIFLTTQPTVAFSSPTTLFCSRQGLRSRQGPLSFHLGFRVKELLLDTKIQLDWIDKSSLSPVPPWLQPPCQAQNFSSNVYQTTHVFSQEKLVTFYLRWTSWNSLL